MNKYVYPTFSVFFVMFLFIGFIANQGNASEVDPRPLGKDLPVYSPCATQLIMTEISRIIG